MKKDLEIWQEKLIQAIFMSEYKKDVFAENPILLAEVLVKCNESKKIREVMDFKNIIEDWQDFGKLIKDDLAENLDNYLANTRQKYSKLMIFADKDHFIVNLIHSISFIAGLTDSTLAQVSSILGKMIYMTKFAMIEEGILPKKNWFAIFKDEMKCSDKVIKVLNVVNIMFISFLFGRFLQATISFSIFGMCWYFALSLLNLYFLWSRIYHREHIDEFDKELINL